MAQCESRPAQGPAIRERPGPPGKGWVRTRWPVLVFIAVIAAVEIVLSGADLGLWGHRPWRGWAFLLGAFRPLFIELGQGVYPGQPVAMFLTHVFVHVGFLHMAGNLLTLILLARLLRARSATWFLMLSLASAAGGGALFAALAPAHASMTGASGAISGLAAFWVILRFGTTRFRPRAAVAAVMILAALFGLEFLPGIATAWQAHLGGALVGLVAAVATRR